MNVSYFKRNSMRFKKNKKKIKRKERALETMVFLKQNKTCKNGKLNAVPRKQWTRKAVLRTERFGFGVCFQSRRRKGDSGSLFRTSSWASLPKKKTMVDLSQCNTISYYFIL